MEERILLKLKNAYKINFTFCKIVRKGIDNNVYKLYGQEKRFILRESKRKLIYKNPEFEVELIKFLNKSNFDTPQLILNKREEGFSRINNSIFFLFQYIQGKQFEKANKKIIDIGAKILGSLHKETINLDLKVKPKRDIFTEFKRFKKQTHTFEGYKELLSHINNFSKEAKKRIQFLSWGVIHNDYYPDNLIFSKEKAYLIDFDWSCYGPLIKDIALAVGAWSSHIKGEKKPNKNVTKHFLQVYNKTAPYKINYDKDLLFWICFAFISETATFFTDVLESRYTDVKIKKVGQCFSYKKFQYFSKELEKI